MFPAQHPTRLTVFLEFAALDMALELGPPISTGKLIPILLAILDALGAHASRWGFPTPPPRPHMFYTVGLNMYETLRKMLKQAEHIFDTFE